LPTIRRPGQFVPPEQDEEGKEKQMENTLISTSHCADVARALVTEAAALDHYEDDSITTLSRAACAALAQASEQYLAIYDEGRESQSAQAVPDFLAALAAFAPLSRLR
jgi:hypothetical protein